MILPLKEWIRVTEADLEWFPRVAVFEWVKQDTERVPHIIPFCKRMVQYVSVHLDMCRCVYVWRWSVCLSCLWLLVRVEIYRLLTWVRRWERDIYTKRKETSKREKKQDWKGLTGMTSPRLCPSADYLRIYLCIKTKWFHGRMHSTKGPGLFRETRGV